MTTSGPPGQRATSGNDKARATLTRLYLAEILSGAGDGIFWVALVVLFADEPNFGLLITAAVLARLGPRAVFSLAAGAILDRWPLRSLLVTAEALRGALMAGLGAAVAVGTQPAVVLGVVLVSYTIGVPTRPGLAVALPRVSGETRLAPATAALSTIRQLMTFIGPFLGVGVAVWSPAVGFAVNGASFALSAALLWSIPALDAPHAGRSAGARSRSSRHPGLRTSFQEGLAVLRKARSFTVLAALVSAVYFVLGAQTVLHVLVVRDLLDGDPSSIGYLSAAMGFGALLSMPVARWVHRRPPALTLLAGVALTAVPTASLALTDDLVQASTLLVLVGIGTVVFEMIAVITIQAIVPTQELGQAFGALFSASSAGKLGGAVAVPLLASALDTRGAVVLVAAVLLAASIASLPSLREIGRDAVERRRAVEPMVNLLASLRLFEGASHQALEWLAGAVTARKVAAGTVLMREGDDADDIYVAQAGTFDVTVGGEQINTMGPGAWFGEIGLVNGSPRSATVTARTDATVVQIPGRVFLSVLEASGAPPSAVVQGIADRLATGSA